MKLVYSFVFACFGLISSTQAIGTRGGGNVIICFAGDNPIQRMNLTSRDEKGRLLNVLLSDDQIKEAQEIKSFDLYEAELSLRGPNRSGRRIIEASDDEGPAEYVERLASRWEGVFPEFSKRLRAGIKTLSLNEARHYPYGVTPEQDFSTVGQIDTSRCVLSTLFVQETIEQTNLLHVDDRLWNPARKNLISSTSRAVAYLHELVYFDYRQVGHQTSDAARALVAYLVVEDPTRTLADWKDRVEKLGAPYKLNLLHQSLIRSIDDEMIRAMHEAFHLSYQSIVERAIDWVDKNKIYVESNAGAKASIKPLRESFGWDSVLAHCHDKKYFWAAHNSIKGLVELLNQKLVIKTGNRYHSITAELARERDELIAEMEIFPKVEAAWSQVINDFDQLFDERLQALPLYWPSDALKQDLKNLYRQKINEQRVLPRPDRPLDRAAFEFGGTEGFGYFDKSFGGAWSKVSGVRVVPLKVSPTSALRGILNSPLPPLP